MKRKIEVNRIYLSNQTYYNLLRGLGYAWQFRRYGDFIEAKKQVSYLLPTCGLTFTLEIEDKLSWQYL